MSNPVFNPLVALQKKPEITNAPNVNIRFHGLKKQTTEKKHRQPRETKEPRELKEIEENQEEIIEEDDKEPYQRQSVKIVNKRKGEEYRQQVLQRLYENSNIPFVKISKPMEKTP